MLAEGATANEAQNFAVIPALIMWHRYPNGVRFATS
jgi:hypothetical protein